MQCIHIKWELFIMCIITFSFVQVYIFTKSIFESCNLDNDSFHCEIYTHTYMMSTSVLSSTEEAKNGKEQIIRLQCVIRV